MTPEESPTVLLSDVISFPETKLFCGAFSWLSPCCDKIPVRSNFREDRLVTVRFEGSPAWEGQTGNEAAVCTVFSHGAERWI